MCFELISEYSRWKDCMHSSTKFLFLSFLHSLDTSLVDFVWPSIAVLIVEL